MKRTIMMILFVFICSAASADTATDALLQSWLKAIGGKEKVASIRTYSIRSEVETSGLKGIAVETGDTAGNHKTDLNLSDVYMNVTVYNAAEKKGWMLDQNKKAQDLEGRDLEYEVNGAYLASYAPFFPDRMKAEVTAAGASALRIVPDGGRVFTVFFDPATGLPVRMEQPEQDRVRTIYFSDWRAVDGVLVAFKQRQTTGDPKYDALVTAQEVKFNAPLEANAFGKPAEAGPDYRFAEGDRAAGLPITLNSNHIFVDVSVNGSAPLSFLLDTGADTTVINLRRAKELGFALQGSMEGRGAGEGSMEVSFIKDASFKLQGVELQHQLAASIDMTTLEGYEGHPIDGILGFDFISRFVIEIDYAGRKLNLFEPKTFAYKGEGQQIPIVLQGNSPIIRTSLTQSGKSIEGKFDIDTGNRTGLVLNRPFDEQHRVSFGIPTIDAQWGMGVGGRSKQKIGRVADFALGGFKIMDVLTSFSGDAKGAFADPEMAGNIGGEILRRFTVVLDYSRKTVILEPNKDFADPFRFDMSGLNLSSISPSFKVVQVSSVTAGSPAAAAGLREGDVIVSIDGKPAAGLELEAIRMALKEEGATRVVTVSSGGKVREVRLTLKPLI